MNPCLYPLRSVRSGRLFFRLPAFFSRIFSGGRISFRPSSVAGRLASPFPSACHPASLCSFVSLCWLVLVFGSATFFTACTSFGQPAASGEVLAFDTLRYAKGFTVQRYDTYTAVEIPDPWDSTRVLQRYLLVDRTRPVPAGLPKGTVVKVPARKVVVYTSVHAAILDQLGVIEQVAGVCEPRYMDTPAIQEGVASGRIADLGEATSPDIEQMIELGAELIIASPFQNSSYGPVEKIGIPILEAADYMESLPLGRTEWVRLYGLLFGKEAVADSIFRATEQRYLDLKALAADVSHRPTVLTEKRFGSTWFVPAGDSYMAHLYKDAGGAYLFGDLPGSGSVPWAFESVFDRAIHADVWFIKYNSASDLTYGELRTEYAPYAHFDAFRNRRIYGCNTGTVPYYEEFPIHPDYLLHDLIVLLHPELLPGDTTRYFFPMKE